MPKCRYCGENAGFFRFVHKECESAHKRDAARMVALARNAAQADAFSPAALRRDLQAIADNSVTTAADIHAAILRGWREGVAESMADGILTRTEEERLRAFRDAMALDAAPTAKEIALLDRAVRDRLMLTARVAALAVEDTEARLNALAYDLGDSGLSAAEQRALLIGAWEAAVEGLLEDGLPTFDEEAALTRFLRRFNLAAGDVNANGAHRNLIEASVIREVAEGIVPERFRSNRPLPFNMQKSERLVWAFDDVEYSEIRTVRERRGTSHGVSIRVARGLYYSPRTFRSRTHESQETVRLDRGLLGVTTKHVYFHGATKRFRVRYDKIVSFDHMADGFGLMRDAQSAKPQMFRTGDGWFVYNLVANLAQLQE